MSAPSTKQKLLSLVEDMEIVSKELFDMISHPGRSKDLDTNKLVELLIHKQKEIKSTQLVAQQQAVHQGKMEQLTAEVEKRDRDIRQLQVNLKETETILANALYQAKQKLKLIDTANKNKISPDELIKYAYKISSSNAVSAPPTWVPGDPRRPYPTELEMRHGMLYKLGDSTGTSTPTTSQPGATDPLTQKPIDSHGFSALSQSQQAGMPPAYGQQKPLLGQSGTLDMAGRPPSVGVGSAGLLSGAPPSTSSASSVFEPKEMQIKQEPDDVEVMSSDSSSSSSSDE